MKFQFYVIMQTDKSELLYTYSKMKTTQPRPIC